MSTSSIKKSTKKARISKGLFYRPTLKLTTGLYEYASQYDSTSSFPDWHIGEKNRSVTLLNADKNMSLFLSNISIRYTKEVVETGSNILFDDLGNKDLETINNDYVENFDIKVTKSIISEFQEVLEMETDYEDIVSRIKKVFLYTDFSDFSTKFTTFHNVSYVADFKDENDNLLSVLIGPANKQEVNTHYANHIVNEKKQKKIVIGNNNLFLRLAIRKTSNEGIVIDSPSKELKNFDEELRKIRNNIVGKIANAS